MAFKCLGKASIYIVNALVLIAFGILPIAYLIIFADIFRSLVKDFDGADQDDDSSFWYGRIPYVILVAAAILPLVLKKHLAELKIASILLFSGAALFAFFVTLDYMIHPGENYVEPEKGTSYYWIPHFNDIHFIGSIGTAFVAYSF